ncbi:hypothetical protein QN360_15535, partial [Glaciimonas sp. CA11.2]|uniref:hypothetical protein n=1 Tax=Glaciimonas sp. CA11.2 TaxID=3048601 RepID=UPI002B22AF11
NRYSHSPPLTPSQHLGYQHKNTSALQQNSVIFIRLIIFHEGKVLQSNAWLTDSHCICKGK